MNQELTIDQCVEVRDSKRHGKGVFALVDISKGTRLCEYDGEDIKVEDLLTQSGKINMDYAVRQGDIIRFGYKTPKSILGIGQLVNDVCIPDLPIHNTVKYSQILEAFDDYEKEASSVFNVCKYKNSFWVYAIRDIRKDEELTMFYGRRYWILKEMESTNNPNLRLILFHMLQGIESTVTDEYAKEIIEGVMGLSLELPMWKNFDCRSPKELLQFIMKENGIYAK